MNTDSNRTGGPQGLLVFDLDGTLIDSVGDLTTAINRLRSDYRLAPLPADTVRRHVGDGVRKLVERSLAEAPFRLDEAVRIFRGYYERHMHDTTTLYPGVAAGLRRLHAAGYRLAVISNKAGPFCRALLDRLGVGDLFGCTLGDGDTARLKPDSEPLRAVMQRLHAAPADTWMIGDHHTDLEMARRAGVRSVFVTYGLGQAGPETPTAQCDSFADVVTLLTVS
ncbi:MAG: HAD-IIIA family hydrolase [Kiritimatiellaeota bacterium]|nr:HAD-IIIA family hydrolase [Kiritimatiellota bacterium]